LPHQCPSEHGLNFWRIFAWIKTDPGASLASFSFNRSPCYPSCDCFSRNATNIISKSTIDRLRSGFLSCQVLSSCEADDSRRRKGRMKRHSEAGNEVHWIEADYVSPQEGQKGWRCWIWSRRCTVLNKGRPGPRLMVRAIPFNPMGHNHIQTSDLPALI